MKLNLGCGNKIKEGWTNVDIQKREGIDKSFDFEKFPYPFKKNQFDYVLIDNVLEHIKDTKGMLKELHRICKPNAIIEVIVPYYNSYWAHSDPTHVHYFNEDCMKQTFQIRDYENKDDKELFKIMELKSIPQRFLSWIPMCLLNCMKRFMGNVIVTLKAEVMVLK